MAWPSAASPTRPTCERHGRQRPRCRFRRHSGHAPLALGRGSQRLAGRRSPGHASPRAERSRRDHGDRSSGRLRPPGLLDAQLATGRPDPELPSDNAAVGTRPAQTRATTRPALDDGAMAHQGLQRHRPGRRPLDLTGPGAVRRHDLARAEPGGYRLVCPEAALASGFALVGDLPHRAARLGRAPHGLGGASCARFPLSVDDGQIVARFPAGRDGAQFPIRTPSTSPSTAFASSPTQLSSPTALIPIRLRHPESGSDAGLNDAAGASRRSRTRLRYSRVLRIFCVRQNNLGRVTIAGSPEWRIVHSFRGESLVVRWHLA